MKKLLTITYISGIAILPVVLSSSPAAAQTQQDETKSTIRVAANPGYDKAGKMKRFFFGDHYRKEWATPVDIELLDMEVEAGGLTVIKMGGGLQTKSLRLRGGNGREYVLRTVDKDPSKAIVYELRGTFADDVVQDQISSGNPYAPLVVASLAEAAGIFHTTPKLVYVTKSPRLGEFGPFFDSTLCLLEERPSGSEEDNAAYNFSKKILNTEKVFEKVLSNSSFEVDQKAFLKARLFDMLIGDWDRHEDQWLWASFEKENKTIFQPIPRDRDQAFSKMDGVIPQLATRKWAIRKIQHFDNDIRDVVGLNYAGIHLDRNFTTKLSLDEWMTVISELQNEMTDAVIDESVKKMPLDIYNISGKEIAEKLKHRRDNLDEDAADYYRFISKEVNITGTTGKEVFEVTRIDEWLTRVVIYKTDAKGGKSLTIYQRTFLAAETKEIRLYGLEGDDRFDVIGNAKKGILIRIIGGKGVDSIADLSTIRGTHRKLSVYDDSKAGVRTKATNVYISSDSLKNDYNPRSFRFDWLMPTQNPGYNPDDGFYAGAGFIYKKQQFGKEPFGQMHTLGANYAFRTGAYTFRYKGIFREVAGKWDLHIGAEVFAPNYIRNYYGLGNETIRREDVSKDYYRVRFDQITIGTSLQRVFGEKHTVSIGSDFQSVKVEKSNGRFISSAPSKLDSADFGRKNYTRVSLDYTFSSLDYNLYPRKGVRFNAGTQFIQSIKQTEDRFAQMYAEAAFYRSLGSFTLATRTGIATNIGDRYEFFQANTLGGMNYLRGFRRDRFAGKTAVYSNTELRFRANTVNAYIVKGAWGLLAFTDHGRVWMPGEESNEWHMGYGGGVWFLPFNRMALTATYGISKEDRLVNVRAGFFF